jgi:hypothetical protein
MRCIAVPATNLCHGFIAASIGFLAMKSLPFQLTSLARVHCRFHWLNCHEFIIALIGFMALMRSPSIWLVSLPVLGYIAFPIVQQQISCYHAITFDQMSLVIKPHLPFGASFAFWRPICLLVPHLPFGTQFAFWGPIRLLAPHLPFGIPVAFGCLHSICCAVSIPMTKGHMGQCPATTPHF